MKNTHKNTNLYPFTDEKDVVDKEYCDNSLLSYSKKYILCKNITELRNAELDKVTTKTIKLIKTQFNYELVNEFTKSANEIKNTVYFCRGCC